MASTSITQQYENLPKLVKVIIQLFLGGIIGGVYRIIRFLETKNIVTLIVGILCLCTGIGNTIAWVIDIITEIASNRITVFAD